MKKEEKGRVYIHAVYWAAVKYRKAAGMIAFITLKALSKWPHCVDVRE